MKRRVGHADGTATHEWWHYDSATSEFGKIWQLCTVPLHSDK